VIPRGRTGPAWIAVAALAAAVLVAAPRLDAQGGGGGIATRRVGLLISGGVLHATFGYRDAFTPAVRKKMTSGLPTRLLVHVAVERESGGAPAVYWARSEEIVYDLWEENFAVTLADAQGKRHTRVAGLDQAVDAAGVLWRAPVADSTALAPGPYRLRVLAEVNPVSEEMVRNIQRWIARPKGGRGESEARSNFFGAFVGHFVDRSIGQAERVVAFVSQWFKLGQP
jgi:hypothetical protein